MLARPLVAAAAVLLSAGVGSLALAGGTSSATSPAAVVYGPVALPVVVPLEPAPPTGLLLPVRPRPLGPPAGVAPMGPPGVVGPDSPPHRVRAAQRLLNRAGAGLRVDGAWGPETTRAVQAVQARAGLPVDGRVGPATAAVLAG